MTTLRKGEWKLDYDVGEGGLVLQNVFHDGDYSMAKDIRVTRIWVDTEYPSKSDGTNLRWFVPGSKEMPADGPVTILERSAGRTTNPSAYFSAYDNPFGLEASFTTDEKYPPGSPDAEPIGVTQRYLFGHYGPNPPHEPGGVLEAAHFFPLLNFGFDEVKTAPYAYPKYFRADFRLDVNLNNVDERELAAKTLGTDTTTNKAGIFRDNEDAPSILLQLLKYGSAGIPGGLIMSRAAVGDLFAFLEKPVERELASWGLARGAHSKKRVRQRETWDNIHVWPAKRAFSKLPSASGPFPVSTPGAFHALHCHWRWGAVSGAAPSVILPKAGEPQFRGVGWTPSRGGALVHERLPWQNLHVAITKNDRPEWAAGRNPSTRRFQRLFTKTGDPRDISQGDDLVLWFSFEVFRRKDQLDKAWGGWLFVNGLYFAHNVDGTPFPARVGGAYGEAQRSNVGRTRNARLNEWERLARP